MRYPQNNFVACRFFGLKFLKGSQSWALLSQSSSVQFIEKGATIHNSYGLSNPCSKNPLLCGSYIKLLEAKCMPVYIFLKYWTTVICGLCHVFSFLPEHNSMPVYKWQDKLEKDDKDKPKAKLWYVNEELHCKKVEILMAMPKKSSLF
jgi:hypothetical protein